MARDNLKIVPALEQHAAAIVKLQESIYAEGSWFVGDNAPYVGSLQRRLRSLDAQQQLYLITRSLETNAVVAWLELNRFQAKRLAHVATLTIAVHHSARRKGIARRMLQQAYQWAKRVGVIKIQLHVRAGNQAAIALYQAEGFAVEGQESKQIRTENGFEDNVVMARFL